MRTWCRTAAGELDVRSTDAARSSRYEEMCRWRLRRRRCRRYTRLHEPAATTTTTAAAAAAARSLVLGRPRPLRVLDFHRGRGRGSQLGVRAGRCRRGRGRRDPRRRLLDALEHRVVHGARGRLHRAGVALGQGAQVRARPVTAERHRVTTIYQPHAVESPRYLLYSSSAAVVVVY